MSVIPIARAFRLKFNNIPGIGPAYLGNITPTSAPTLGLITGNGNRLESTLFIVEIFCYPSRGNTLVYSNTNVGTNVIINPYQIRLVSSGTSENYYITANGTSYNLTTGTGDCSLMNPKTFKFISAKCTEDSCPSAGTSIISTGQVQLQDTRYGNVIAAASIPLTSVYLASCNPQSLSDCSNMLATSIMTIELYNPTESLTDTLTATLPNTLPMVPTTTYPIVIVVRCNCKKCKC